MHSTYSGRVQVVDPRSQSVQLRSKTDQIPRLVENPDSDVIIGRDTSHFMTLDSLELTPNFQKGHSYDKENIIRTASSGGYDVDLARSTMPAPPF